MKVILGSYSVGATPGRSSSTWHVSTVFMLSQARLLKDVLEDRTSELSSNARRNRTNRYLR